MKKLPYTKSFMNINTIPAVLSQSVAQQLFELRFCEENMSYCVGESCSTIKLTTKAQKCQLFYSTIIWHAIENFRFFPCICTAFPK